MRLGVRRPKNDRPRHQPGRRRPTPSRTRYTGMPNSSRLSAPPSRFSCLKSSTGVPAFPPGGVDNDIYYNENWH